MKKSSAKSQDSSNETNSTKSDEHSNGAQPLPPSIVFPSTSTEFTNQTRQESDSNDSMDLMSSIPLAVNSNTLPSFPMTCTVPSSHRDSVFCACCVNLKGSAHAHPGDACVDVGTGISDSRTLLTGQRWPITSLPFTSSVDLWRLKAAMSAEYGYASDARFFTY